VRSASWAEVAMVLAQANNSINNLYMGPGLCEDNKLTGYSAAIWGPGQPYFRDISKLWKLPELLRLQSLRVKRPV